MREKPPLSEYVASAISEMGFPSESAARRVHDQNLSSAVTEVQSSGTWKALQGELAKMRSDYLDGHPDLLFSTKQETVEMLLLKKSFDSMLLKAYRTNIMFNRKYPNPPPKGIELQNIYEQIDDLVRSRLVCRYIDGPRFVCEKLALACGGLGVEHMFRAVSTEAGYHAWHFYYKQRISFIEKNDVVDKLIWVEIQVSTQLAEVITALTHHVYESHRTGKEPPDYWQWSPDCAEFKSAYLGHGLHLFEGVILGFRDDMLKKHAGESSQ